jgi:hypothetical protein
MVQDESRILTGPKDHKWPTEKQESFYAVLQQDDLEVSDFQALLGLPLFVGGSERIDLVGEHHTTKYAMELSALTGLPMINGMLSRVSYDRARKVIQLTSHPWLPKKALQAFTDQRPLLLVTSHIGLHPYELRLIGLGQKLGELDAVSLYRLPFSALRQVRPNCDTLREAGHLLFKAFDDQVAAITMSGNGALPTNGPAVIFDGKIDPGEDSLEVSIWMHADSSQQTWPNFYTELYSGEELIDQQSFFAKHPRDIWGDWIRLSVVAGSSPEVDRIKIGITHGRATFDNLMIRPLSDTSAIPMNDQCLLNNYPIWEP